MRCLALAEELRKRGYTCSFACRRLPGDSIDFISEHGFDVCELPSNYQIKYHWAIDARETMRVVTEKSADWLVVDNYCLDKRWHKAIGCGVNLRLVIDDLANREYECDILLDQNLGHTKAEYQKLTPNKATILVGPKYALLREEFRQIQPNLRKFDFSEISGTLLVSLGGIDAHNLTSKILIELFSDIPKSLRQVKVILGQNSPWAMNVEKIARKAPILTHIYKGISNMSEVLLRATVVIGAAGTSVWERACLGIPTLVVVIAENQKSVANAIVANGAAKKLDFTRISSQIEELMTNSQALRAMSKTASDLCDGLGVIRLYESMLAVEIKLRAATMKDSKLVFAWRKNISRADFYLSDIQFSFEEHRKWFKAALSDDHRKLFVATRFGYPVGHVHFHFTSRNIANVGIVLNPHCRGNLMAKPILQMGISKVRKLGIKEVNAVIHQDNLPSIRLFKRCTFRHHSQKGHFGHFRLSHTTGFPYA